jgi:hypothetical protein
MGSGFSNGSCLCCSLFAPIAHLSPYLPNIPKTELHLINGAAAEILSEVDPQPDIEPEEDDEMTYRDWHIYKGTLAANSPPIWSGKIPYDKWYNSLTDEAKAELGLTDRETDIELEI